MSQLLKTVHIWQQIVSVTTEGFNSEWGDEETEQVCGRAETLRWLSTGNRWASGTGARKKVQGHLVGRWRAAALGKMKGINVAQEQWAGAGDRRPSGAKRQTAAVCLCSVWKLSLSTASDWLTTVWCTFISWFPIVLLKIPLCCVWPCFSPELNFRGGRGVDLVYSSE